MRYDTLTSLRFKVFAWRLGETQAAAVGLLECLWMFTSKHAMATGDITDINPQSLADWMEWGRDHEELFKLLFQSEFLQLVDDRILVVDWERIARDYREPHGRRRDLSSPAWRRIRQRVIDEDGTVCAYCGCDCSAAPTVDHVVPVVAGGTMDRDNLVVACRPCNSRKGDRQSGW